MEASENPKSNRNSWEWARRFSENFKSGVDLPHERKCSQVISIIITTPSSTITKKLLFSVSNLNYGTSFWSMPINSYRNISKIHFKYLSVSLLCLIFQSCHISKSCYSWAGRSIIPRDSMVRNYRSVHLLGNDKLQSFTLQLEVCSIWSSKKWTHHSFRASQGNRFLTKHLHGGAPPQQHRDGPKIGVNFSAVSIIGPFSVANSDLQFTSSPSWKPIHITEEERLSAHSHK